MLRVFVECYRYIFIKYAAKLTKNIQILSHIVVLTFVSFLTKMFNLQPFGIP